MTDYGTIKIPRDEYEKHNEKRQAMNLTWAEYMNEEAARPGPDADLCEEIRELRKASEDSNGVDYEDLVSASRQALREELPDRVLG